MRALSIGRSDRGLQPVGSDPESVTSRCSAASSSSSLSVHNSNVVSHPFWITANYYLVTLERSLQAVCPSDCELQTRERFEGWPAWVSCPSFKFFVISSPPPIPHSRTPPTHTPIPVITAIPPPPPHHRIDIRIRASRRTPHPHARPAAYSYLAAAPTSAPAHARRPTLPSSLPVPIPLHRRCSTALHTTPIHESRQRAISGALPPSPLSRPVTAAPPYPTRCSIRTARHHRCIGRHNHTCAPRRRPQKTHPRTRIHRRPAASRINCRTRSPHVHPHTRTHPPLNRHPHPYHVPVPPYPPPLNPAATPIPPRRLSRWIHIRRRSRNPAPATISTPAPASRTRHQSRTSPPHPHAHGSPGARMHTRSAKGAYFNLFDL
ncbi:hypothetical protein R3P38DRAFT_3224884 [Favolaschia claudopus]|uniref:Uncharacterized protein n=1 Tax=Favolaschia claudopus TaxID=2862362 RepID=A0AAV9ZVK0_9AGAR